MTNKTKIIWIGVGTVVLGGAIWIWWRQKDAVPLTAMPVMQQARAVLATTSSGTASSTTSPQATSALGLQATLESLIPGYIPLPSNTQ